MQPQLVGWPLLLLVLAAIIVAGGILSIAGIVQVARSQGALRGLGLAIAGLVMSCGWIVILPVGFALLMARSEAEPPRPVPAPPGPRAIVDPEKEALRITNVIMAENMAMYDIADPGLPWLFMQPRFFLFDVAAFWEHPKVGLQLARVDADSAAWQLGFREGDVIQSVNDMPVRTLKDLSEVRASAAVRNAAALTIGFTRDGKARTVDLRAKE